MGKIYDYVGNVVLPESELEGLDDLLPGRLLVWHDEFPGANLDLSKWTMLNGRHSTNGTRCYSNDPRRTVDVSDGLTYKTIKDYPADGIDYTCPFLATVGLFEFQYGRIEAKIKFPSSTAYHSTLWTLGACGGERKNGESILVPYEGNQGVLFPSNGEIDIAEFDNNTVGARMHWSSGGFDTDTYASGGEISSLTSTPNDWHIYSAEWTESTIEFYVDGVKKLTWNTANGKIGDWNPFQHPHYIILNCIVSLSGTPTWDIMQTNVAWVRVYAPENVSEYIEETGISIDSSANISVGERKWLQPTFTPAIPSDMTLKWYSHNENIVTCYGGMLVGIGAGTTFIQCTTKHGHTALCKVTVS